MAEAIRDGNQVTSALGSSGGVPIGLKVEHATGYLKVKFKRQTLAAPTYTASVASRDGNNVPSALATLNGLPKAILADATTGYLRVTKS